MKVYRSPFRLMAPAVVIQQMSWLVSGACQKYLNSLMGLALGRGWPTRTRRLGCDTKCTTFFLPFTLLRMHTHIIVYMYCLRYLLKTVSHYTYVRMQHNICYQTLKNRTTLPVCMFIMLKLIDWRSLSITHMLNTNMHGMVVNCLRYILYVAIIKLKMNIAGSYL